VSRIDVFVMEWAAIIRDLVIGLLIAGAIAAWVPGSFWQSFFFAGHPLAAKLWGPLIGQAVAVISFVRVPVLAGAAKALPGDGQVPTPALR
jgi:hypothetical protein